MNKIKNIGVIVVAAVLGGIVSTYIYTKHVHKPEVITIQQPVPCQPINFQTNAQGELPNFTYAAENSVKSVVHITTKVQTGYYYGGGSIFDFFFGEPNNQQREPKYAQSSGSGVILSEDGYIVTNNHVIESSETITVVLNDNRTYEATLVGADPTTDIALLKIESDESLPAIALGSSDELRLGEWVLAVGNPYNLSSTVTAGIVSAKARGIGIISGSEHMGIESFIQTDAAVNPGNSGGALVNTRGELVGINTAIASRTGSYSGYSFAVPVTIMKKVTDDLREYGAVQRALLGVSIVTMNDEIAQKYDIDEIEGVFVAEVVEDGAADNAGIKDEDVIIAINNQKIKSVPELQELVSQYNPGDKVEIIVKRDNKEKLFNVILRNKKGGTGLIENNMMLLGANLEDVSAKDLNNLGVRNGVRISSIESGKIKDAGVKEDFIVVFINKQRVSSTEDFKEIIQNSNGGVLLEGLYPNGREAYFVFNLE